LSSFFFSFFLLFIFLRAYNMISDPGKSSAQQQQS